MKMWDLKFCVNVNLMLNWSFSTDDCLKISCEINPKCLLAAMFFLDNFVVSSYHCSMMILKKIHDFVNKVSSELLLHWQWLIINGGYWCIVEKLLYWLDVSVFIGFVLCARKWWVKRRFKRIDDGPLMNLHYLWWQICYFAVSILTGDWVYKI